MKTKLVLLALVTVISSASFAQGFKFGIKAGANVTKIDGSSFKEEFKYGYHVGAFVEIKLAKKFVIQPELLWNQINTDTSSNFRSLYSNALNLSTLSNVKLGYLSIPVLLNYKVANILSLQLGPQYGILIDKTKTVLQNGKDAFKKGDFSVLGGAQLNISSLRVYARYNIGLTNLNDIDNKDKWKSQGFQVGVGVAF
ncbi:MAG TPA: porin family protein [Chitinophagaceae bacterium]|nr:porin family protein [Chitinophagaceae bacterium]